MEIWKFDLCLDNPDRIFHPGQLVTGKIILEIKSQKSVEELIVKIEGQGKVSWKNRSANRYSFRNRRNTAVVYHAEEKYLYEKIHILEAGVHILDVGQHRFGFAARLPRSLPSTFKNSNAMIEYDVQAVLCTTQGDKKFSSQPIVILNELNLNSKPFLKEPLKKEIRKRFWIWYECRRKSVRLSALLPLSGFAPMQSIPLFLCMENEAKLAFKGLKCYLIQKIQLKVVAPYKKSRILVCCLAAKKLTGVQIGTTKTWNEILNVPDVSIPYLQNCQIIDISYELQVKAAPKGLHTNMILSIPLTLGNIPLYANDIEEEFVQL